MPSHARLKRRRASVDQAVRDREFNRQRNNALRRAGQCPTCNRVAEHLVQGPWGELALTEAWCGEHYWATDRLSGKPVLALGYRMERTTGQALDPDGSDRGHWWHRARQDNDPPPVPTANVSWVNWYLSTEEAKAFMKLDPSDLLRNNTVTDCWYTG